MRGGAKQVTGDGQTRAARTIEEHRHRHRHRHCHRSPFGWTKTKKNNLQNKHQSITEKTLRDDKAVDVRRFCGQAPVQLKADIFLFLPR